MHKILLFGATGMAGHMVYHYLHELGKYHLANAVFRRKLTEDSLVIDVMNRADVIKAVRNLRPDIIINCVGVLVHGSKTHPDNAIYINAYLPLLLKKTADEIGAKLIHISTDCVFSGVKGNYRENDFRDADDIYGRSKALGEILSNKDLTIRTSIIGPELKECGEGLFHWFMHQHGKINGYTEAIWGGVTTLELAKAIDAAIARDISGLIHLSNGTGISKFEMLKLFQNVWQKKDVSIIPYKTDKVDKSIAKSPDFDYEVPSYKQMMDELHQWMVRHTNLYEKNYGNIEQTHKNPDSL